MPLATVKNKLEEISFTVSTGQSPWDKKGTIETSQHGPEVDH